MQITGTPNIFSCISTTPDIRVEHIDLKIFYELCITLIMMSEEEVLSLKASRLLSFLEKNGTPCENTGDALTSMIQFVQMPCNLSTSAAQTAVQHTIHNIGLNNPRS
jgi:hypothetical protein